jgi:hypothetical protein
MRKAGLQLVRQSARSLRCASQPTKSNGQTFGPIPSPGTTRSRHHFSSKEIYFAMSKIHGFAALYRGFECERAEVFCNFCTRKVNTFGM